MADYNINKSNGAAIVVPTGGISNQFDIPLIGQDAINYGDDLATAQLRQLENFAFTSPPSFGADRTIGQLWYDTTASEGLKVWDGGTWDLMPLDTDVVHLTGSIAESITGEKTFTDVAAFNSASVPFTVNSTTTVINLSAQLFDGDPTSAFADATQGALADTAAQLPENSAGIGFVLTADLSNNYTWESPASGTGNVDPVDAGGDDSTTVLLYSEPTAQGAIQPLIDEGGLTYNANSKTLTTTFFSGTLQGNAATATIAVTATSATTAQQINVADTESTGPIFLVMTNGPTGNQIPVTDETLVYNASSGALSSTSFSGIGTSLTALSATNIASGTLNILRGGSGSTTITGTGANVLAGSPTFTTEIFTPRVSSSGAIVIEWNNVSQIQTQDHNVNSVGITSGAQVKAHSGTFEDIGFNTLPLFNYNTSDVLQERHCGHSIVIDDGGSYTLTLAASGTDSFPVGGVVTIINGSAVDYDVNEGSGNTLFYIEGGVGGSDTGGTAVLGPGGVATLYRFDDTDYFIWGSEITF